MKETNDLNEENMGIGLFNLGLKIEHKKVIVHIGFIKKT